MYAWKTITGAARPREKRVGPINSNLLPFDAAMQIQCREEGRGGSEEIDG